MYLQINSKVFGKSLKNNNILIPIKFKNTHTDRGNFEQTASLITPSSCIHVLQLIHVTNSPRNTATRKSLSPQIS